MSDNRGGDLNLLTLGWKASDLSAHRVREPIKSVGIAQESQRPQGLLVNRASEGSSGPRGES